MVKEQALARSRRALRRAAGKVRGADTGPEHEPEETPDTDDVRLLLDTPLFDADWYAGVTGCSTEPERAARHYLRHGARRGEVARPRLAPQVGTIGVDALQRGQLRTHRGRICGLVSGPNGIDVSISGGGTTARVEAAVAVDCTGPTADPATGGVVLRDLLARGLARRDPHGLGIVTTEDGAVVDRAGRPSEVLFAIGVLRRGAEWESTAVPELRAQADALATLLTHSGRRVAA